ncbi:hypothetical protein [Aquamicrobium soli]|jgi:curli biogenesis system outer membrane secretion channel CsgG|uniref:Uncharacterized protein n=1 Tax=Aquamicrobium soli TaxID=1811518 RepID=A0ABV7K6W4_9HYPH
MKTCLLALAILMAAAPSFACTAEEAQAKATELATKLQELSASDPQKATEVSQKMAAAQTQSATDLDGVCKLYDDMLTEVQ